MLILYIKFNLLISLYLNFLIESIPIMTFFKRYFDNFIGYLIILNVLHQIFISSYSISENYLFLSHSFIFLSFCFFSLEIFLRILNEKRFSFLLVIDLIVLINYFFINTEANNYTIIIPTMVRAKSIYIKRTSKMTSPSLK